MGEIVFNPRSPTASLEALVDSPVGTPMRWDLPFATGQVYHYRRGCDLGVSLFVAVPGMMAEMIVVSGLAVACHYSGNLARAYAERIEQLGRELTYLHEHGQTWGHHG